MYTAFYGLREKPFKLSPDPRYLYLADSHREALAHVLYGIEQGEGFIAVTGEVGMGKTTICRTLLQRLGPDTDVAFLFNPRVSGEDLLRAICSEFALETEGRSLRELGDLINQFLLEKKEQGRSVLLIVDEAQNLSNSTLEEIRLLSNLETSTSKLIQILLFGQPELDAKLDSDDLRQLRQRITVRWSLDALSSAETRDYVRHRIRVAADGPCELFSDAALREVHRRARGVPRLVNIICDRALLSGYAENVATIEPAVIRRAAREILGPGRLSSRPWVRAALAAAAAVAVVILGAGAWQLVGPGRDGAAIAQTDDNGHGLPDVAAGPPALPTAAEGEWSDPPSEGTR